GCTPGPPALEFLVRLLGHGLDRGRLGPARRRLRCRRAADAAGRAADRVRQPHPVLHSAAGEYGPATERRLPALAPELVLAALCHELHAVDGRADRMDALRGFSSPAEPQPVSRRPDFLLPHRADDRGAHAPAPFAPHGARQPLRSGGLCAASGLVDVSVPLYRHPLAICGAETGILRRCLRLPLPGRELRAAGGARGVVLEGAGGLAQYLPGPVLF